MVCDCEATGRLCDACVSNTFAQLGGVAARRGELLADKTAVRTEIREPWPRTPKAFALVVGAIADLSGDERLRSKLAAEAERFAIRRWEEIRAGSPPQPAVDTRR